MLSRWEEWRLGINSLTYSFRTRKSLDIVSLCCRPIILDPADPTHNVAQGYRWDIVAQRASQCLKQDCCYDDRDAPVPSWTVKVMVPPSLTLEHYVCMVLVHPVENSFSEARSLDSTL